MRRHSAAGRGGLRPQGRHHLGRVSRAGSTRQGFAFDYVLYSNYERQVEDLVAGRIHVAWNSPLAWVRARRLAEAAASRSGAGDARHRPRPDVGRRRRGPIVGITTLADLRGTDRRRRRGRLAAGHAAAAGAHSPRPDSSPGETSPCVASTSASACTATTSAVSAKRRRALARGEVDAACMIDANHLLFGREGTLPAGSTRVLAQTAPFDHCNMTVAPGAPAELHRSGSSACCWAWRTPMPSSAHCWISRV